MLNIAVIGFGYWGPNLVRVFSQNINSQVLQICDLHEKRLLLAQRQYPQIATTNSLKAVIHNPAIDAVAIATPVRYHYEIAEACLRAGKHVLIEKPITATSLQALRLLELSEKQNLILMVDHTFLYTPAVQKIRQCVAEGDLGEIYCYDSTRINLGLVRHDVNVVWDLAIHDLAILDYVLGQTPTVISATGQSHVPGNAETTAFLTAYFNSKTIAHINVNWLSPIKLRRTLLGGSRKMIVYDDLEVTEKIKIYDRGVQLSESEEGVHQVLTGYRLGDMLAPSLPQAEALQVEVEEFLRCIIQQQNPLSDARMGLRMVSILEAASKSIIEQGMPKEVIYAQ